VTGLTTLADEADDLKLGAKFDVAIAHSSDPMSQARIVTVVRDHDDVLARVVQFRE